MRALRSVLALFLAALIAFSPTVSLAQSVLDLPQVGVMLSPSVEAHVPALLKGVRLDPADPLKVSFVVDSGNDERGPGQISSVAERQVRYFLAALTIPEDQLWVNLSPHEADRIIMKELGETELGRDMLAQDYILKQLTASLIYPERDLGRDFWQRLYVEAQSKYGVTDIPVDVFNKVWIVPEKAVVLEHGGAAYVTTAKLKVMLEADYLAEQKSNVISHTSYEENSGGNSYDLRRMTYDPAAVQASDSAQTLAKNIVREIVIPAIEKEVNEGAQFIYLRQLFHAIILAKWYRQKISGQSLGRAYLDQNKTAGVDIEDKEEPSKIYDLYVGAYQKGVFDLIREDKDALTGEIVPRKYFSGGLTDFGMKTPGVFSVTADAGQLSEDHFVGQGYVVDVSLNGVDRAMRGSSPKLEYPGQMYQWNVRERKLKFNEITTEMLWQLKDEGINVLWMDCVWQTSPFSERFNKYWDKRRVASGYSIYDYKLNEEYGTESEFRLLVKRASAMGMKVILSEVPNHLSADSPIAMEDPDLFVNAPKGSAKDTAPSLDYYMEDPDFPEKEKVPGYKDTPEYKEYVKRYELLYFTVKTKKGIKNLAHGKDPNFIPWKDTVQFDWSNPRAREFILKTLEYILDLTDGGGMRIDMTHLTLREKFNENWRWKGVVGLMDEEFWPKAIAQLKEKYPQAIFISEVYNPDEGYVQQLGIDFTYGKYLFEYLVEGKHSSREMMEYLVNRGRVSLEYLTKTVHWLENHDNPDERVAKMMTRSQQMVRAIVMLTVPGMPMFHNGQRRGHSQQKPGAVWITQVEETEDPVLIDFYNKTLPATNTALFRLGEINWVHGVRALPEGVFAYQRKLKGADGREEYALVVANNSDQDQYVQGSLEEKQWGIGSGESGKYIFKDIFSGTEFDRPVGGVLDVPLKPNEYHVWKLTKTDAAGGVSPTGGIDVTRLDVETSKAGSVDLATSSVDVYLSPSFQGFRPVIEGVAPAVGIRDFLGFTSP